MSSSDPADAAGWESSSSVSPFFLSVLAAGRRTPVADSGHPAAPSGRVSLRRPSSRIAPAPSPLLALAASPKVEEKEKKKPLSSSSGGGGGEWREAGASAANWSALLDELLPEGGGARVSLAAELADGRTSLWPRAGGERARAALIAVVGGGRWRVALGEEQRQEEVGKEERRSLVRSVLGEVEEVVCWRAKDVLVAMGMQEMGQCPGLRDPQIGLWLLEPDVERMPLEQALRQHGVSRNEPIDVQQEMLWQRVKKRLEEADLTGPFVRQEMRLVPVLARLELTGMLFDAEAAHRYTREIVHKMDTLQREATVLLGNGRLINLGSAQQMAGILFDELGLTTESRKKTTGGSRLSLSKDALIELRDRHPLAAMILQFRKLQKLHSTWLEGLSAHVVTLPDAVRKSSAPIPRVCSEWQQTCTRTGRLSSINPNMQNLPRSAISVCLPDLASSDRSMRDVRICVRDLFVCRPGYVLLSCDYAQMEMRILASLSGDTKLREFFRGDRDIHKEVFAHWKRKSVDAVTAEEREISKRVVYAIMYGMGAKGLMGVLKCTLSQAQTFLSSFLSSFPQVRAWMDRTVTLAVANKYVQTISGRRRLLPDADKGRHLAVNSVVQGSAADLIKMAMISLQECIELAKLDVLIVSSVHDEIVCEVRFDQVEQARQMVVQVMQTCGPGPGVLTVPLIATSKTGASLGQLK